MANQTLDNLASTGLYNIDILDSIKSKNFSVLKNLSPAERSSATYMYPLLWAVKDELGTFEVYSYMGEDLQRDPEITGEVIKVQPDLIVGTPLSRDRNFILTHIQSVPILSYYMSESLKTDTSFIMELCAVSSPEIAKQILENVEMRDEEEPMASMEVESDLVEAAVVSSIIADPSILTNEQKNDAALIKAAGCEDYNFIKYVADHASDFGYSGLQGASEAAMRHALKTGVESFHKETSCIKNADELLDFDEELVDVTPSYLQRVAAMVALGESIPPEMAQKIIDFSKIQLAKANTPEGRAALDANPEAYKQFITPEIIHACAEVLQEQQRAEETGSTSPSFDPSFIEEYATFHRDNVTMPEPFDWCKDEEAYYDEQIERREQIALSLGIDPEEYAKTHPIMDYEDYVAMRDEHPDVEIDAIQDLTAETRSSDVEKMTTHIKSEIEQAKEHADNTNDEIVQGD